MKTDVLNLNGEKIKEIELPSCFNSKVREDIIKKVYNALLRKQPYGSYVLAGKTVSASGKQSHQRHKYKTLYGRSISRIPRKIISRRGDRFYWVGAFVPGTVKGREAHPPKPVSRERKINKKEKRLAIISAIASTASINCLKKKYPNILEIKVPIIISNISKKTKEMKKLFDYLEKITGMKLLNKKIRAGKGKMRGRKYKTRRKVLLVTAKNEEVKTNLFDIMKVNQLSIVKLAPSGISGRLVIYTEKAINELSNMFKNEK